MTKETQKGRVAATLRDRIESGFYPPGGRLPRAVDLAAELNTTEDIAYGAFRQLAGEGLVTSRRHGGTKVREIMERMVINRARGVLKDDRGYFFDEGAKHWVTQRDTRVSWRPAPADIASILGSGRAAVLCRDRAMGPRGGPVLQLTRSWVEARVARSDERIASVHTGGGGIYERFEELGHGPLSWTEKVGTRMPEPGEQEELQCPPGVPVLRILRITRGPGAKGPVLEVCEIRLRGDRYEVSYPLRR